MQPEQELELDLRQLWNSLMRRKWVIALLFVAAVTAAYFVSNAMTPIYEATTSVLVKGQSSPLELAILEGPGSSNQAEMQTSLEIFRSRTLALETARRLGYDWDEYTPEFRAFRSGISVSPVSGANMIRISVQGPDPREAALVANALVESFVERSRSMNSRDIRAAREFVEEQLVRFQADLEAAEEALVLYQQAADIVTPSGETAAVLQSITTLETRLAEAMVARETATRRLEALQEGALADEKRSTVSGAVVASNPLISAMRSQLVNLEAQLAAALEQYTDRHPTVVSLTAQIAQLRTELNEQIARLETSDTDNRLSQEIVSLQAEIVAHGATIDALQQLIADREALLGGLPEKELRLTRLIRNAKVTEEIYIMLLQRYQEMRISEAMETANITVLDPAVVPATPIKPRRMLNMAIAGFLGLFVGVGVAFLLEYFDTTFKQADELESYLDLPLLGRAPTFRAVSRGYRPY